MYRKIEGEFKNRALISKKRCSKKGLNPNLKSSKKKIEGYELQKRFEENKELIIASNPIMSNFNNLTLGLNYFLILTDKEGCILSAIGNEKILDEAFHAGLLPGAFMDEDNIGTNAMSLVLDDKKPIQITHVDHYIKLYHKWTCSAAPIFDISDELIGVINLTGYKDQVHPHTLGLVVSAANAIMSSLKNNNLNEKLVREFQYFKEIINISDSGLVITNTSGEIILLNNTVRKFVKSKHLLCSDISNWNDIWINLKTETDKNGQISNKEIKISIETKTISSTVSIRKLYNDFNEEWEYVFYFRNLKMDRRSKYKLEHNKAIYTFDKIIGQSEYIKSAISYCKKISNSNSTILISGESGTGKEVFAQSIHNYSNRKDESFVAINCGAIQPNLIESELFGYVDGAFTGAKKGGSIGKFELSSKGTIFLDEIGEMPLSMQTKLLRVIEEGTFSKVGGNEVIVIDVRIIAATNKDLYNEVLNKKFRKDLYYRLNVLPLFLHPLKERVEDIPILIDYYIGKISARLGKKPIAFPDYYMKELIAYSWPGNIRELVNLVEYILNTETFPNVNTDEKKAKMSNQLDFSSKLHSLEIIERQYILKVLQAYNYNIKKSSEILGIGRNTLYRKIEKYQIVI